MMITGDYHHTVMARDVGMVKPKGSVNIIDKGATLPKPYKHPLQLGSCIVNKGLLPDSVPLASTSVNQLENAAQQADDLGSYQIKDEEEMPESCAPPKPRQVLKLLRI